VSCGDTGGETDTMKFYIVDAFTEVVMGGNTAGVILLDEGSKLPEDSYMRRMAEELKYNITVFVRRLGKMEFGLKFFSPADEVDLCGHATIAAFTAMQDAGWIGGDGRYAYRTSVGTLEAVVKDGFVLIEQGEGQTIRELDRQLEQERLYEILGIGFQEVYARKSDGQAVRLLPTAVSTGIVDMMVPVEDRETLAQVDPDFHVLKKMSRDYGVASFHVYCRGENGRMAAYCRNFAPLYGVMEDIATGTANASLAYHLYCRGLIDGGRESVFVQGEALGRSSKILAYVNALGSGRAKIQVGGKGAILVKGEIALE